MTRSHTHATVRPPRSSARPVLSAGGRHEREAEHAAAAVVRGGTVAAWSFSTVPVSAPGPVQREETAAPKSDEDKHTEGAKKIGEAVLETPAGKALKERVFADPLVKTVKDAVTSTPGMLATGALAVGGVTALGVAKQPLPFQAPAIPLDAITPGLSAEVKVEGPVNAPTFVGLALTYKEQGPKGKADSDSSRIAADVARLKAQQQMFKPAAQKAAEKAAEDALVQAWIRSQSGLGGLTIPLTPGAPTQAPAKEDEKKPVQRVPTSASAAIPGTASVDDALSTPGRPLDPPVRHLMEQRFGHDFSMVRIHDDARAAATAARIEAAAFTVGQDVVFGAGRYSPATSRGRALLAHELAHTIQQRGAHSAAPPLTPGSALERSADSAGRAAAGGLPIVHSLGTSGLAVARQFIGNEEYWGPQNLPDEGTIAEFWRLWFRLKDRKAYPQSDQDLARFSELSAQASRRSQVRREALAEADAAVARINEELQADDQDTPAGAASIGTTATPSRFRVAGFSNAEIDREVTEGAQAVEQYRLELLNAIGRQERQAKEQVIAGELPGVGYYQGPVSAFRAERNRGEILVAASKIQGVKQGGVFGTAGRVVGATTAWVSGKDVQAGGEIGAVFGGALDARMVVTGGAKVRAQGGLGTSPLQAPGMSTGAGRPAITVVENAASIRSGAATPDMPAPAGRANVASPAALARTAHPDATATTLPDARARTVPDVTAKTLPDPRARTVPDATANTLPAAGTKTGPAATAQTLPDPHGKTLPDPRPKAVPAAPAAQPPQYTQPSAPAAPRASGRGVRAVEVTAEEVAAAYRANPASVHRSWLQVWHEQMWLLDRGQGAAPRAFRAGRVIVVDPDFPL